MSGPDELPVAETGRGTLDAALYNRFLSSRTLQPATAELAKLGMLVEDDAGVNRATVAGVLLATERPDRHIPGAAIEAVRYRGNVLGKASQLDATTIVGPVDRQIREAVLFSRRNTRVAARKAPGRVETPQFSPRAVFEAIVNAVVHRDYSLDGARIRMFIFDDRLELYSPGALAPNESCVFSTCSGSPRCLSTRCHSKPVDRAPRARPKPNARGSFHHPRLPRAAAGR